MLENISSKNGRALLGIAFSFLLSNASLGAARVRRNWSPGEDDLLRDAVRTVEADKVAASGVDVEAAVIPETVYWKTVAALVPNRTPNQCRDRWNKALDLTINNGPWTEADERSLIHFYLILGRKWKEIAEQFPGRTDKHCRSGLASLVAILLGIPYKQACDLILHPTPEFLEDLRKEEEARYGDLDAVDGAAAPANPPPPPASSHVPALGLAADGHGVAATGGLLVPRGVPAGVPAGARPGAAKVRHSWTPREDYLLRGAVAIFEAAKVAASGVDVGVAASGVDVGAAASGVDVGAAASGVDVGAAVIPKTVNWTAVATLLPNRTPKQCQDRWVKALDSAINKGPWTAEEDQILVDFHQSGEGWTEIAGRLPGRIDHQCRYRYKSLIALQQRAAARLSAPSSAPAVVQTRAAADRDRAAVADVADPVSLPPAPPFPVGIQDLLPPRLPALPPAPPFPMGIQDLLPSRLPASQPAPLQGPVADRDGTPAVADGAADPTNPFPVLLPSSRLGAVDGADDLANPFPTLPVYQPSSASPLPGDVSANPFSLPISFPKDIP